MFLVTACTFNVLHYQTEDSLEDGDLSWCKTTFSTLLEDPSTHDVTFKTSDGGSVSAHRVIVAAGSPVFHAMLYGNMKESSQKEIELPNIDSSTLKMLFHFIYTGHVITSFTKCFDLLLAADFFGVAGLITVCSRIIESDLRIDDLGDVAAFAMKHQFNSLLATCMQSIEEVSRIIVCNELRCRIEPLQLPIVIEFLKSSNLIANERDLFCALEEWCKQHEDELSTDDIKLLFSHIRYPLMEKNDLIQIVHPRNMADPDLYKAALEYRETGKYDGPEDQLTLRKFYFDFAPMQGLEIEHTPKGTLITKSPTSYKCVTLTTSNQSEYFIFCVKSCSDKSRMFINLINLETSDSECKDVEKIPIGEEIYGQVSVDDDLLCAEFGELVLRVPVLHDDDSYAIVFILHNEGDQISIVRD